MPTIDNLDIQIAGSAKKANDAIDSLIDKLGNLATSLKFDTSGLEKIGKSINVSGITNATKNIQLQAKEITKSVSKINTELGKGFQFHGSLSGLEKQIDKYKNNLEAAKVKVQELRSAGKYGTDVYTQAINKVLEYKNIVESLEKQLAEMRTTNPVIDFKITGMETAKSQISDIYEKLRTVSLPQSAFNYNADAMKAVFGEMASGIENWSQAIQQFGSNAGTVFNQVESNAKNLKAETKDFESVLNSLKGITPQINETNLAKLQSKLKSVEEQAEKLRYELEKGLRFGTIEVDDKKFNNLTIKIKEFENQAELLKDKIKEVENTSRQMSGGVRNFGDSIKSASNSILDMANSSTKAIKPLNNLGNSFKNLIRTILPILGIRQIFNWGKQSIEIASDLTEVQNVVDTAFKNMAYKVEEFAETSIEQFGLSELSLKEYSSRFQAMGTAMGFPIGQMSDMSIELTKLTADMASFYNVEQKAVAEDLESIFTGTTRPLRQYGLDLTQATLQEWALKQGLDANIQSMSQSEKTMLRYQYVMANTGAAQGDFARTVNTWANQVRILKQNFQQLASVIGGVLVNAFKPIVKAVNSAMSAIIAFAKTISNALGKIFGWTYEEGSGGIADDFGGAADAANDIAGGMNDAAGSAKKLKSYLLGIDELNVIEPDAEDEGAFGGGGAGGLGGIGEVGDGKWVQGESILKAFESEIDSLYELGEYIRDALIRAMESIDWDSVYKKARGFGKGLAEFLNGLLAYDGEGRTLFGEVAKTLANTLNAIIYAAESFAIEFDFEQLGNNIADAINKFFENFDFVALANTIDAWVQGIWTTIKTAIAGIKWETVWDGVKEFLNNIDLKTVAIAISTLTIKKILGLHLASSALSFIGTTLSKKIAQAIAGKLGIEIAKEAGIGTALATGLKSAFSNISGKGILDIGTVFSTGTLTEKFAFVSKMLGGIGLVIGGVATAVTNFFDMWKNGFDWLNEALMVLGTALAAVGAVILGAPALIAGIVAAVIAAFGTIITVVHDNWDEIASFFTETIPEWWNGTIIPFFQSIPEKIGEIWENVKTFTIEKWNSIVLFVQSIPEKIGEIVNSIANWFSELPGKIGYSLGYALGTIINWGMELFTYLSEKIPEIVNNVVQWFSEMKDKIGEAINLFITETLPKWKDNVIAFFTEKVPEIILLVREKFLELKNKIGEAINLFITETLPKWKDNVIAFFTEKVPEILEDIYQKFLLLKDKLWDVGKYAIEGLWEGVKSTWSWLTGSISNFCNEFVNGFKDALGIHSPSKVFEENGQYVVEGFNNGILNSDSTSAINLWLESIKQSFSPEIWEPIFRSVGETFKNVWIELTNWFNSELMPTWFETGIMPWFSFEKWHDELLLNVPLAFQTMWEEILLWWNDGAMFVWWEESVMPWFTIEKWQLLLDNIRLAFLAEWIIIVNWWNIALDKWWKDNVLPKFTYEKWFNMLENVRRAFEQTWGIIKEKTNEKMEETYNVVRSWCNEMLSAIAEISSAIDGVIAKLSGLGSMGVSLGVKGYATGGFPDTGQLFIAREAGAEMIGSIGGHTAVANNDQIVEGISYGVRQAVAEVLAPYLADIASSNREIADKDMSITIGDEDIALSNRRGEARLGFNFTPSYA